MLNYLDKWLDHCNEFAEKHEDFCFAIKAICVVAALIAAIVAFIVLIELTTPEHSDILWEGDVQTEDTRIVHCIATTDGMSCDWTHASGADNL